VRITSEQLQKLLVFVSPVDGKYFYLTVPEISALWNKREPNLIDLKNTRKKIQRLIKTGLVVELDISTIPQKTYSVSPVGDLILRYVYPHLMDGELIIIPFERALEEIKLTAGDKISQKFIKKRLYTLRWGNKKLVVKSEKKDILSLKFPTFPFIQREELKEYLSPLSWRVSTEIDQLYDGRKKIHVSELFLFLKEKNPNRIFPAPDYDILNKYKKYTVKEA